MITIQEARTRLGIAQSELARRLGVSAATVSQTEAREARGDVTLRTRARYLDALGLRDIGLIVPYTPAPSPGMSLDADLTVIAPSSPAASSRSRRRSLLLHRLLEASVNWDDTDSWLDAARADIRRNRRANRGTLHLTNTERWAAWIEARETSTMRERMCAEDEDACQLREVSPWAGLLTTAQRQAIIDWEREHYAS